MQPTQSQVAQIQARAPLAVCLMMFGVFLCFPGAILTGIGNSSHDEFFEPSHRPMRIIGPILLCAGFILIIASCCLCCVAYRTAQEERRQRAAQPALQTGPVISGYMPGPNQSSFPIGPQHPQGYQSSTQPGAYSTGSGYQYSTQGTSVQPQNQYGEPAATISSYDAGTTSPSAPPPSYDAVMDKEK